VGQQISCKNKLNVNNFEMLFNWIGHGGMLYCFSKKYTNFNFLGNYKITYEGDGPVTIIPSSGTVPAHSQQAIRVEYVTRVPGAFREVAR